jgi:cytochrome P450
LERVYKRELDLVVEKIKAGTQRECFATEFIKQTDKLGFNETQKLFVMGTLIEAGSDTSRVSIGQIIAGAATYPDWVIRARKELDSVCGENAERLPGWEDRDKLPYITAVVKEGFRWRPNLAEIGAPTMLIKDDDYEGYKFPAGTVFVWNAWAIALDPKEYAEPERFYPDRFLNEDLTNPLKGHWGFGPGMFARNCTPRLWLTALGRRVCVGWNVGEMNVWIAIARLLYCFDFAQVQVSGILMF